MIRRPAVTHLGHEVSSGGVGVSSREGISKGHWVVVESSLLAGQSVARGGSSGPGGCCGHWARSLGDFPACSHSKKSLLRLRLVQALSPLVHKEGPFRYAFSYQPCLLQEGNLTSGLSNYRLCPGLLLETWAAFAA